jgi:hypothetical protein
MPDLLESNDLVRKFLTLLALALWSIICSIFILGAYFFVCILKSKTNRTDLQFSCYLSVSCPAFSLISDVAVSALFH